MTEVEAARAAKAKLVKRTMKNPHVVGVGITMRDGHYVVKVNLIEADPSLPATVDHVPVVKEVVGRVRVRKVNPPKAS